MACLLCMLTSHLHQADVIPGMPTVHADITIMSCWRHSYPGQPCGSGQLVFGSGQPIRAKKTRGARLRAWADALPESDGECGHVWRSILTPSSPVASSRLPLHSGMVKTPFWELSFLSKNQTSLKPSALIPIVGEIQVPHARTGGVLIVAQRRVKHTDTIFYVVRQIAYINGRKSILFRDRERITTQYMEEEDHFTQTQLPALLLHLQLLQWQQGCCHCSPSLSLYTLHILTPLLLILLSHVCL
jgi:hypothetical protein